MKTPAPADLHRWSEELARNPASLAFLPLARAYRRLGRRDLALQLCLRGLEHHPTHVEAHALLALLYFEAGERAKAADEWATVLRLKPGNFEALRGMGFRYLEQGDITRARQHLERAALIRPDDATVQEALRLIRQREATIATRPLPSHEFEPWSAAVTPPAPAAPASPITVTQLTPAPKPATATPPAPPKPPAPRDAPMPWEVGPAAPRFADASARATSPPERAAAPTPAPAAKEAAARPAAPSPGTLSPTPARPAAPPPAATPAAATRRAETPARPAARAEPRPITAAPGDPALVFDSMKGGPLFGVLLLDRRGLVLAGSLGAGDANAEELGAILGSAIDEAVRTVTHLALGQWQGLLLDCEAAALHVTPIGTESLVVVAAHRDAPAGWLLRTASHAVSLAERFVGVYS